MVACLQQDLVFAAIALGSLGCVACSTNSTLDQPALVPSDTDAAIEDAGGDTNGDSCAASGDRDAARDHYGDVSAVKSNDIWVFLYEEQSGEEAVLSGTASVRCGCLAVGGTVVIWDSARLAYVEELTAELTNGEAPYVYSAGGETDQVPSEVFDRCPSDSVFYENSDY